MLYLSSEYGIKYCRERNHARGSSKRARICLACKMRSRREKRAIGKIELASSRSWIVFDVSTHINYHIMRLTRIWQFGLITCPARMYRRWVSFESRRRTTRDKLGYGTAGEDWWGREKGIFTKRFVLQLKCIGRHDCIWKIISSLEWKAWIFAKPYEEIDSTCSFCCWGGIPSTPSSFKYFGEIYEQLKLWVGFSENRFDFSLEFFLLQVRYCNIAIY